MAMTPTSKQTVSPILNRRYLLILILCGAAMAVTDAIGHRNVEIPHAWFLPMHMILEFASIVVSFAVFATGWYGYKQTGNRRDLAIGVTFFAAGAIDFIHTLSYKGMPDFMGVNTPGRAAAYWLAARLIVGIGLVIAARVNPGSRHKPLSVGWHWLLGILTIVLVGGLVVAFTSAASESLYDPTGHGLTTLKVALEYIAIAIYFAAFFAISERRGWDTEVVVTLRQALLVIIFAELAFTLYFSPFGWMNALGHIFKIASYYAILTALMVSAIQRPYQALSRAKEELQELYADAQEHRSEIEKSFARIGSALSSSIRLDDALDRIAELVHDMVHVDCAVVLSLETLHPASTLASVKGECHELHRPTEVALTIGKDVLATRKSVVIPDLKSTGIVTCSYDTPTCLRSMACVPMVHGDQPLGLIAVFSYSSEAFEESDVVLLEGFAAHAAVAVHNAITYEHESRIANVLQRSLLGSAPGMDGKPFEIAEVYVPAAQEALVGGDFYDVVELTGDRIAIAIGDVSGKGLAAAVHTALARYALRAYLTEGHPPARALALLNEIILSNTEPDTFITMFLAILDTKTGELVYANAGHEPPLLASGSAYQSLHSTGAALGLFGGVTYDQDSLRLHPESVLLMFTDGISEARRGPLLLGSEGVGEAFLACKTEPSTRIAQCIYEAALEYAGGELKDDAAILAIKAN